MLKQTSGGTWLKYYDYKTGNRGWFVSGGEIEKERQKTTERHSKLTDINWLKWYPV